ncbi:MAG: tRNA lysidine(34) synthetase TilS [Selenomonadaceae bacterium]|nr:tRNA lysidine(34) synthetase TilS [Selenomonadaceae bacterium]
MIKKFIDFCQSENIFYDDFAPAQKIVVAVSGGADSLALADLLYNVRQRFKLQLCIAHYEHGLRGQDSLDDAAFVEEFAKNLGVKFFCEHGDVKKFAAENKISIETAARKLRYNFLNRVREDLDFDAIALAHHADDQAETILMRLLRGATSAGLSAMKFIVETDDYGTLLRPLLRFRKVELESYCALHGLVPRIDATNFETDATRNKIRWELLPALEKFNPNIVETLCRLGEVTADEADFIDEDAEEVLPYVTKRLPSKEYAIVRDDFLSLHKATQRAVIKKFLAGVTGIEDFGFVHFEAVRKVLVNGLSGVELPHKFRADLQKGKLTIRKNI